jgi:SAM-dependent methyltransferase
MSVITEPNSIQIEQPETPPGRETFRYLSKNYIFDITRAIELVGDGREPVELDEDDVRFSLKKVRINQEHLERVDVSRPGILAIVHAFDPNGAVVKGHRLIDGHHRAARCLELGRPFPAYLLTERESIDILLRSPCKPLLDTECTDVREFNQRAWNQRVINQDRFCRPATDDYLAKRSGSKLAGGWLPDGVAGKRVLLLAAGGGRQSARYAEAGALVTVVDISGAMLELDRKVAAERGYNLRIVETSMDDLSMFEPGSFDIVNQPVSTCYVPDVIPVYREVARVLVQGGLYLSQHKQPASLQASMTPTARGYELVEPYNRNGPLRPVTGSLIREEGTVEFLHRWEDLIGGLCRNGFVVEDLSEPNHTTGDAQPGSFAHFNRFAPPYVRIKARRTS